MTEPGPGEEAPRVPSERERAVRAITLGVLLGIALAVAARSRRER